MVRYLIYAAAAALVLWAVWYTVRTVAGQLRGRCGCDCSACGQDCPRRDK